MTSTRSTPLAAPGSPAPLRSATTRPLPPAVVYRRRRAAVSAVLVGFVALVGLGVGDVLAGPGDDPASAAGAQSPALQRTVVAMPGDSLWSIAERVYAVEATENSVSLQRYVEALIELNGGTRIDVGQRILLP